MWVCGTACIRSVLAWTSWRRWLIRMWPGSSPHTPPWCFSPRCWQGLHWQCPWNSSSHSGGKSSPGFSRLGPRGSRGLRPTKGTGGRPEREQHSLAQPGPCCLLPHLQTSRLLPDLKARLCSPALTGLTSVSAGPSFPSFLLCTGCRL